MATVTQVPAGADLQQYIDAAQPGDTLVLQANATYAGNFTLPSNTGNSYITITSSDLAALPPAGDRVDPSYAPHMPKLVAPPGSLYSPIVQTLAGAHHFAFIGIEFSPSPGQQIWDEIVLGANETSADDLPHDFIFDRCYIHGDPAQDAKTGLVFNGVNMTAENNYISAFKSTVWDTAAIGGWNGPGPFTITNNYLEASGENLFWGGATPSLPGVIPSDFEIQGNYFSKPLSWRISDPSYAGTHWLVKNLLEFKAGRRIMIEGNIFENCWADAQSGYAIVLTMRTEGGTAPWLVLEDITFRNNIVRHAGGAFSLLGKDNYSSEEGNADSLQIYNNFFYDINNGIWGGPYSALLLMLDSFNDVTATHNTALDLNVIAYMGGLPFSGFAMENNIVPGSHLGIIADGMNNAQTVFNAYAPDAIFTSNAIIGGNSNYYPGGNFFPASLASIGFINAAAGDYTLAPISPFIDAGTDGMALGADMKAIDAATSAVISGTTRRKHQTPRGAQNP
jgi:hypothetical protein